MTDLTTIIARVEAASGPRPRDPSRRAGTTGEGGVSNRRIVYGEETTRGRGFEIIATGEVTLETLAAIEKWAKRQRKRIKESAKTDARRDNQAFESGALCGAIPSPSPRCGGGE